MTDYSRNLASAVKSIHAKGRPVDIISYANTGTSYDPILTPTPQPTIAVQSRFNSYEVDGTAILSTDRKYLFAGSIEPKIGMKIEDGGISFEIKNVWQVKPGDTLILSKVQARL